MGGRRRPARPNIPRGSGCAHNGLRPHASACAQDTTRATQTVQPDAAHHTARIPHHVAEAFQPRRCIPGAAPSATPCHRPAQKVLSSPVAPGLARHTNLQRHQGGEMPILRIEHPVPDFDAWKKTFDSDPLNRLSSNLGCHRSGTAPAPNAGLIAPHSKSPRTHRIRHPKG